jgi:hypothetical protein
MKKTSIVLAAALAVTLIAAPAFSQANQTPPQAPTSPQQTPQSPQSPQSPQQPGAAATQMFEGELTKVDTNLKTITVKGTGAGAKEMSFVYNDSTTVVGGDKTVQGLASKTGTNLRISYRQAAGNNQATRIEIVEKQAPQSPAGQPGQPGQPGQQPR